MEFLKASWMVAGDVAEVVASELRDDDHDRVAFLVDDLKLIGKNTEVQEKVTNYIISGGRHIDNLWVSERILLSGVLCLHQEGEKGVQVLCLRQEE
ncbi:hypothetical protein M5K25_021910 [Dendrobium thyrsiflorum]|uniref:Uncharacterized protein n=1 Tax=Dendrobium thyrsiflorum TaxID=117978 RepID=A0ABD0U5D6_DENTH